VAVVAALLVVAASLAVRLAALHHVGTAFF
jgi:hypothetical protein